MGAIFYASAAWLPKGERPHPNPLPEGEGTIKRPCHAEGCPLLAGGSRCYNGCRFPALNWQAPGGWPRPLSLRDGVSGLAAGEFVSRPKWRNGRRAGLKNRWGQPRVSSTLTFGTRILPQSRTQRSRSGQQRLLFSCQGAGGLRYSQRVLVFPRRGAQPCALALGSRTILSCADAGARPSTRSGVRPYAAGPTDKSRPIPTHVENQGLCKVTPSIGVHSSWACRRMPVQPARGSTSSP